MTDERVRDRNKRIKTDNDCKDWKIRSFEEFEDRTVQFEQNRLLQSDQKIFYKKHDRNNYKLGEVRHAQITESVRGDV